MPTSNVKDEFIAFRTTSPIKRSLEELAAKENRSLGGQLVHMLQTGQRLPNVMTSKRPVRSRFVARC